jgi:hypothetical protein
MWISAYEECPQARYTGIALEYGTQPMDKVMLALRGDHWLALHGMHQAVHGLSAEGVTQR